MNEQRTAILIIGAGPAGIAAYRAAKECGREALIVDDNPAPGGQIWRGDLFPDVPVLSGTAAWAASGEQALVVIPPMGETVRVRYQKLILATGARERFLPFPGWTLPGVTGAGGLQALVKSGLSVAGRRVVVAGSGPLLLAVAAYIRTRGAQVVRIAEQTSAAKLFHFALRSLGKLPQAALLRLKLIGVPYTTSCWPLSANGGSRLESVRLRTPSSTWTERCDYLACGFGLVPNTELAQLLGCKLQDGFVVVDAQQQTSVESVYCAGEPTGIGGLEKALAEGDAAGRAASGKPTTRRDKTSGFQQRLAAAFSLREELKHLPSADTVVCRCEDVTFSRVAQYSSWRDAKMQSRCGMGPCQGRVCGPAIESLLGWTPDSVRGPLFPAPLRDLADE